MNIAFTISSRNYFSQTRATLKSFLEHNKDFQVQVFCIDDRNYAFGDFWDDKNISINFVKDMEIENNHVLRNKYNDFEYCNALKPFLTSWIFSKSPEVKSICYLDSDLFFYNNLAKIHSELEQADIILTPHSTSPYPHDEFLTSELDILNSGLFNAGFFAVKRSANTMDFLNWWKEKTLRFCKVDFEKGMFVDQIWLNFVPLYFKSVLILNDPGYNMAHWNLHERNLTWNAQWMVNDQYPLVFYHFSGFSFENIDKISKHQNRYTLNNRIDLEPLFINYKKEVAELEKQLTSIIGQPKQKTLAERIQKFLKKHR